MQDVVDAEKKWPVIVAWCAFGLVVLFYLSLKSFCFHWQVGDENIYFYMAWSTVDHGALPYSDFFFAHPPLHILPGIAVFGLLGFGPFSVRLIPIGATLVGAFFLFRLARARIGSLGGVATVFLYLTAFSLIRASTHWTGINLAVMWCVLGLWAHFKRRPATAGVFLALGVCTGNYVLPAALMLGILAFLDSRPKGRRYLLGFAVPWAALMVMGLALGGTAYLKAVYAYHLLKPQAAGASYKMSVRVFSDNFALFLGVLLGPLLAALDGFLGRASGRRPERQESAPDPGGSWLRRFFGWWRVRLVDGGPAGLARVGALWALGYVLFIAMLPRVFPFYFLLMFPGMALAGGYAIECWAGNARALVAGAKERGKHFWEATAILVMLLVAVGMGYFIRVPIQQTLLPLYTRSHDKPMKWSDGRLPGFINRAFRACCWDDVAQAYTAYGTVQEILYHESRYFEKAEELAGYVREHSNPDQAIFGDSSTAGLVALLSGRRLSADFADTNVMRFRSGVTTIENAIRKIDTPKLTFILASGSLRRGPAGSERLRLGHFASLPRFRRWLGENFEQVYRTLDRTKGWFFLLKKKHSR